MKIGPVGSELFHVDSRMDIRTDGRTDRHDEVNSRFGNFSKAPTTERTQSTA